MPPRKSTFELLGLPQQFGAVLLTLSLILLISPYLAGADFGILKVPDFQRNMHVWLRILGPLAFAMSLALFIPFWRPNSTVRKTALAVDEGHRAALSPDAPTLPQSRLPSSVKSLPPDRLKPRRLILQTEHSRIEEAVVLGTRCIIKSTQKELVDLAALQTLTSHGLSGFFQETDVCLATPEQVWVEGDQVCELHPFYEGLSLYRAIRRNRYRITADYLGLIFTSTVEVLARIHQLGILHRDVNPTNMLVTNSGKIVLLDLSFACQMNHQHIPVENPAFSAPEQLLKKAVPQSDFYSLAASICFLANGREPDANKSSEKFREQILNIDFGPFGRMDIETHELLFRMLSNDVQDRPKSYRDLLLDTATWPVRTSLFSVLDLDHLGFMVLSPYVVKSEFINSKENISAKLRDLIDLGIRDIQLRADVQRFLAGENPWLA